MWHVISYPGTKYDRKSANPVHLVACLTRTHACRKIELLNAGPTEPNGFRLKLRWMQTTRQGLKRCLCGPECRRGYILEVTTCTGSFVAGRNYYVTIRVQRQTKEVFLVVFCFPTVVTYYYSICHLTVCSTCSNHTINILKQI